MNVRLAASCGASFTSRTRTQYVLNTFSECRRHNASVSARPSPRTWTQQDIDELLKLREEGKDLRSIASLIGRTPGAVHTRLWVGAKPGKHSSRQKFWSDEDTKHLHDLKAEGRTNAFIAARLGRTVTSVRAKSVRAKLRIDQSHQPAAPASGWPWTQDEIAHLRRMRAQGLPFKEIASTLGRTIRGVQRASLCYESFEPSGSSYWAPGEKELLYRLREEGLPWREIARRLPSHSITALQTCYQIRPVPVTASPKSTPCSSEELQMLHDLREKGMSSREIAGKLPRSVSSINRQLWISTTNRNSVSPAWTPEDITRLVALKSQSKPWHEIADVLRRTSNACCIKYSRLSDEQREQLSKS